MTSALIRSAPLASCALAWEVVARLGLVSSAALPPLSKVVAAWLDLLQSGDLFAAAGASLYRGASGLALAIAVFVGTLLQAPLGLLAVASDLEWPIVMAHLLLSIALLGGAVVLVLEAVHIARGLAAAVVPRELSLLGLIVAAACFAAVVGGAFATAGGPHSGGGDVANVDRLWRLEPLVYIHAAGVGVFIVGLVLAIGFLAAYRARARTPFIASLVVSGLLLAQIGVGELQYWTHLPWWLVLLHVSIASAVWAATVGFAALLYRARPYTP